MPPKRKSDLENAALDVDVEHNQGMVPTEPVDTDDNDDLDADASGDSDDEREDENEAVRQTRE